MTDRNCKPSPRKNASNRGMVAVLAGIAAGFAVLIGLYAGFVAH